MNFTQAVASGFRRYFDFKTRSSRSEYWWWTLFSILVSIATNTLDALLFGGASILDIISSLILFIPGITLSVRRLHDTNRSGWILLAVFGVVAISMLLVWSLESTFPIVFVAGAAILLLFWYVQPGTKGTNKYGPDPLRAPGGTEHGADIDGGAPASEYSDQSAFCSNCGTTLEPGGNFCRSCGQAV